MNDLQLSYLCVLVSFFGTILGAAFVFLLKKDIPNILQKLLLGFASGVMIAASIWSLLLPSIDMSVEQGIAPYIPTSVGFAFGVTFLIIINYLVSYFKSKDINKRKIKHSLKKTSMLIFAITLHNIPEGMAVGVIVASALSQNIDVSIIAALSFSIGIAIQNIPEGAVISMPLIAKGMSKRKAFVYGMLSGIIEPIAAIITILLTNIITPILPYILSFAAGTMIYVVVEELIPEFQSEKKSNIGVIGVTIGFIIMMVLDIAFG